MSQTSRAILGLATSFFLLASQVQCHDMPVNQRKGNGFIGYGINMYNPVCASACRDGTPTTIVCPADDMGMVDADCKGDSEPYLQTVAYCMSQFCPNSLSDEDRQYWWNTWMLGRGVDQPLPSMTYAEALASVISSPPTTTLEEGQNLTAPVLIDAETLEANSNALSSFQGAEKTHSEYGLILLLTGAALPISLSLLRYIPVSLPLVSKIRNTFVDAPLLKSGQLQLPVLGSLSVPTRGQSVFLAYIFIINVVLSCVGYRSAQPNAYFSTRASEITTYIANRSGVLSFANIPLMILYAGRNNILMHVSGWSHATFLLMHRFIAVLATLQACLHSAIYLQIYVVGGTYAETAKTPFWIYGALATITMSLALPLSIRRIRRAAYEAFLASHIILSILTMVGCW